jgi:hypothetical protein
VVSLSGQMLLLFVNRNLSESVEDTSLFLYDLFPGHLWSVMQLAHRQDWMVWGNFLLNLVGHHFRLLRLFLVYFGETLFLSIGVFSADVWKDFVGVGWLPGEFVIAGILFCGWLVWWKQWFLGGLFQIPGISISFNRALVSTASVLPVKHATLACKVVSAHYPFRSWVLLLKLFGCSLNAGLNRAKLIPHVQKLLSILQLLL